MSTSLLKLVKQTSIYSLGSLLMKGAGFLLAFLYLDPELLPQASYGRLALLESTAKVAVPLFGLGLANGLLKFWGGPDDDRERGELSFTAVVGGAAGGAVVAGLAVVFAEPLATGLLNDARFAPAVRLMGLYSAFRVLALAPTAYLRNAERVWLLVLAIFGEMVLLVGGAYVALVVRGAGLNGLVVAYVVSAGLSAVVVTVGVLTRLPWRFRTDALRRLMAFGAPLAVAGLGVVLLNLADRFLLEALDSLDTVAVYDWASRLGSVLYLVLVSSFSSAFSVLGVKALDREGGAGAGEAALHRRTFRHYAVWAGWGVLGLSLAAYDGTRWISPNPAFLAVESLVLPVAAGFMVYGVYYILVNILYAAGLTGRIAVNLLAATLFNVGLNVVLIPSLGALGAALATVLAYTALTAVTAWTVAREVGTRFRWSLLVRVLALVGVLFGVGHLSLDWPTAGRIAWRAGVVLAYLPLVVAIGLYPWREVREVAGRLRDARR